MEISLKRHDDVLLFQSANWLSGFVWFSAFLRLTDSQVFAQIAGAELMFGFFGVFITNLSLRYQARCPSRQTERRLLALRGGALALVSLAASLGMGSLTSVLAMLLIVSTPAHLPLLLKHRAWLLTPLLLRLPLALAALGAGHLHGSVERLAAIYFLPGIIYGVLAYQHYYRRLGNEEWDVVTPTPVLSTSAGILAQFIATAAASLLQARIVAELVVAQPGLALVERLLRSSQSFAYPHLLRRGMLTARMRFALGTFSILVIFGLIILAALAVPASRNLYVLVPTLLDTFNSIAAGGWLRMDLLFIVVAGFFLSLP